MDIVKIIRKNQQRQACQRFFYGNPKSKCSVCGQHYLSHSNEATKHISKGFKNYQLKMFELWKTKTHISISVFLG